MAIIEIRKDLSERELRQFAGIWFPAFGAVVGAMLYWKFELPTAAYAVWAVVAGLAVLGLWQPALIRPVYLGLMYLTFPIGWVVSHLILAVIYFGLITPLGLVMRLFGRDVMQRRFDRAAATYWVPHPPTADVARYFRQF
jgi:hypothetical protein